MSNELNATGGIATVETIFSVGSYEVPAYQRDYSWKEEHVEDLVIDLIEAFERVDTFSADGTSEYFLGAVVTQVRTGETDQNGVIQADKIVDGQQRITTLALLWCVLGKRGLKDLKARALRRVYRADTDDFILAVEPYNYYFRKFLGSGEGLPATPNGRPPLKTEAVKRLESAFEVLERGILVRLCGLSLDETLPDSIEPNAAKILEKFAAWLDKKVFVALIQDTDPYDEQRLFDRINTRGMPLSEAVRFMSNVLTNAHERNPDKGSKKWKATRETALQAVGFRAQTRRIRDPLEAERKLLIAWLISHKIPDDVESASCVKMARDINSDPYDWILSDPSNQETVKAAYANLYNALKGQFFPYVSWCKAAYGAVNRHDPKLAGLHHAHILRIPLVDAVIAACYFHRNSRRTKKALHAAADFLDLVAFFRGWFPDWKKPSDLRDLLLVAIQKIRTGRVNDLRSELAGLLYSADTPDIFACPPPSLNTHGRAWMRYLLGRLAIHAEEKVFGKKPDIDPILATRDEAPEIEHILSLNFQNFGNAFNNDRDRLMNERERLGALTILPRWINRELSNKDYTDRLSGYQQGGLLASSLSSSMYNNQLRITGSRQGPDAFGMKPYDMIKPEMIDEREQVYKRIASSLWTIEQLRGG